MTWFLYKFFILFMCINSCISKCKFFLCSRNPVLSEPPTTWDGNLGCVCAWLWMGGRDARPSVNLPAPAARRPPAAGCPWTPGCPWAPVGAQGSMGPALSWAMDRARGQAQGEATGQAQGRAQSQVSM